MGDVRQRRPKYVRSIPLLGDVIFANMRAGRESMRAEFAEFAASVPKPRRPRVAKRMRSPVVSPGNNSERPYTIISAAIIDEKHKPAATACEPVATCQRSAADRAFYKRRFGNGVCVCVPLSALVGVL